MAKTSFGMVLV